MEWIQDLLKLLFGQLGVVGTVCFLVSGYLAWLHHQEREDHKQTRESVRLYVQSQNEMNMRFLEVITEVKTLLMRQVRG